MKPNKKFIELENGDLEVYSLVLFGDSEYWADYSKKIKYGDKNGA